VVAAEAARRAEEPPSIKQIRLLGLPNGVQFVCSNALLGGALWEEIIA